MTVYVVTTGSYSDYHICGATLDEDLAWKYADHIRGHVEEYDTDKLIDGDLVWTVNIFDDGATQITGTSEDWYFGDEAEYEGYPGGKHNYWHVVIKAKDEDHALKKAYDMIAEFKANEAGV